MARDVIQEEAARWFTRLQAAELPFETMLLEWQQWMARDPRHAQAFARLQEVWQGFESVPRPALLPRDVVVSDGYDGSMPVRDWNSRKAHASSRRSMWLGLAASLVIAAAGVGGWLTVTGPPIEELSTRVGENRTVQLEDGSQVTLGGQTSLTVRLDDHRRELTLSRGEALFSVAKDPNRPFWVRAGRATVTAVGTEFSIRRSSDRVTVSVLEGRVNVQPLWPTLPFPWLEDVMPAMKHGAVKALGTGQQTWVDRTGVRTTATLADTSTVTGWQQGRLSFDDEPLRYAVEAVNRYSNKRIVIADSALENVRVSGTVLPNHMEGWVESLHAAFGIRTTEDGVTIELRR